MVLLVDRIADQGGDANHLILGSACRGETAPFRGDAFQIKHTESFPRYARELVRSGTNGWLPSSRRARNLTRRVVSLETVAVQQRVELHGRLHVRREVASVGEEHRVQIHHHGHRGPNPCRLHELQRGCGVHLGLAPTVDVRRPVLPRMIQGRSRQVAGAPVVEKHEQKRKLQEIKGTLGFRHVWVEPEPHFVVLH